MLHPIKHFRVITKHRHKVIEHCFKAGIGFHGLQHDLSKYSPTEFWPGAKYFQGTASPTEKERKLFGYSSAWMHHQGRNRHHFEYWKDYNLKTKQIEPVKMPDLYVKEMFCDRVAASKIYEKKKYTNELPLMYFKKYCHTYQAHPDTLATLEFLLEMLAQKGEKETFKYLRSHKELPVPNRETV